MYQSVCLHNVKLLFFTDRNRILSSVADKVLCCKRAVIFNIDKHAAAKRHKINIMIAGKSVCKPNTIFDNRKIHMVVTCKTALGWAELDHFFAVFYGEQLCAQIVWCGIIGCIAVKRQAIGSSAHTMAQLAFRQFRAAFLYQILCMLFTLLFHKILSQFLCWMIFVWKMFFLISALSENFAFIQNLTSRYILLLYIYF